MYSATFSRVEFATGWLAAGVADGVSVGTESTAVLLLVFCGMSPTVAGASAAAVLGAPEGPAYPRCQHIKIACTPCLNPGSNSIQGKQNHVGNTLDLGDPLPSDLSAAMPGATDGASDGANASYSISAFK